MTIAEILKKRFLSIIPNTTTKDNNIRNILRHQTFRQLAYLLLLFSVSPLFSEAGFHFHAEIMPRSDGSVEIREKYRFNEDSQLSRMSLTIFTGYEPGRFPLRRRVTDIQLKQNGIKLTPERIIHLHEERTTVLIKKVRMAELEMKYLLSGSGVPTPSGGRYLIDFFPYLPEDLLSASFEVHGKVTSWRTEANGEITEKFTQRGNRARMTPDIESGLVSFQLDFTIPDQVQPPSYLSSFRASLPGPVLPILACILLLSLILRLLPPAFSVLALPVYLLYLVSVFMIHQTAGAIYFWRLFRYTDSQDAKEYAALELVAGLMFVAVSLFLLRQLYSNRHTVHRSDWYRGFLVPMIALMLLPVVSYSLSFLLLVLGAVTLLFFWYRGSLALYFGVGAGHIVEEVEIAGTIPINVLAQRHRLPAKRLEKIIEQLSGTPVAIDHEKQQFLAPALLADNGNQLFCSRCGGLTSVHSADLSVCKWCGADYARSRTELPRKPVPVVVETTAELVRLAGNSLAIALLLFAALGLFLDFMSKFPETESWLTAGFLIILALLIYLQTEKWHQQLSEGRLPPGVVILLTLGIPLVLPLYLLIKLFSPRAKIFFKEDLVNLIIAELNQKASIPLSELSALLHCDISEALDLAVYLCGNHLIDAVFERRTLRLTARTLYRQKAAQNDCRACGGIRTIQDGRLKCLYCGSEE